MMGNILVLKVVNQFDAGEKLSGLVFGQHANYQCKPGPWMECYFAKMFMQMWCA